VVNQGVQLTSTRVEQIEGTFSTGTNYAEVKMSQGYMKVGFLAGGDTPDEKDDEYGMEIGTASGDGVNRKQTGYAKFSTKETALYDRDGNKAAWIDTNSINGDNLVVGKTIKHGRFLDVSDNGDTVTKVVGGTEI
jgi:hypothetical protein